MAVQEILRTHPQASTANLEALARCIDECFSCAAVCTACADACLGEEDVADLVRCVRLDLDCADICAATGMVLSRQTHVDAELVRGLVEACRVACMRCGDECERHAEHHDHCRVCAERCRACEQACADVLSSFGT